MNLARIHDLGGGCEIPKVVDLFIGSVSYEERCLLMARWLKGSEVRRALIAENMNHEESHRGNGERLRAMFDPCTPVNLDTSDPLRTADALRAALDSLDLGPRSLVVVDTTTFTHEALLIAFQLLRRRLRSAKVVYAYTPAEEYSVGLPVEEKWLSRGVEDVRSVLGYPGVFRPSRRLHLVVLVGMENERVKELISQYEPSLISLGYGTSFPGMPRSARAIFNYEQLRALYGDASSFSFNCFDPLATAGSLATIIESSPKHNVVIAALNTKLSTLGAAIAAVKNEQVQLCYAQAILYNTKSYSTPGNELYLFSRD